MRYHTTKYGKRIKMRDLELSHLQNIIALIEKSARNGITVTYGCGGFDGYDMWADQETLVGNEALEWMNYQHYKEELERRMK